MSLSRLADRLQELVIRGAAAELDMGQTAPTETNRTETNSPAGRLETDRDTKSPVGFLQEAIQNVSQDQILTGTAVVLGIIGAVAIARKVL